MLRKSITTWWIIIVRNRSSVTLCQDCLRITIGTRPENDTLLEALKNYKEEEA